MNDSSDTVGSRYHQNEGRRLASGLLMRGRLWRACVGAAAAWGAALAPARAADVTSTWIGGSGNWEDVGNWVNAPAVPHYPNNGNGGLTFAGVIGVGDAALNSWVTIESLMVDGRLSIGGVGLTLSGLQSLQGTGEVVFGIQNSSPGLLAGPGGGTLTIGSGVTVRTGTQGGTVGQMGTGLVNQGMISAQTAGTTLTVQGTNWTNESTGVLEAKDGGALTTGGVWSNSGTIAVDRGTVNLGGTFSFEGGGAISGRRGTVNLTGTLENSGLTWTIDGDVGVFNLAGGGTVKGGTIKSVNDGELVSIAGLLDNVKLETDVAIGGGLVYLQVSNGLTLSNTKIRMVSDGGWYGTTSLSFLGSQTLGGSGEVVFEGKDGRNYMSAGSGVLTIGKGIVIRSGVQGGGVGQSATGLVNQGTISAQTAGTTVTVDGVDWVNDVGAFLEAKDGGTLTLTGSWRNKGTISLDESTVNLGGLFWSDEIGTIARHEGLLNVTGTLKNAGLTWQINSSTGSFVLAGGTVEKGTIRTAGGAKLIGSPTQGVLKGVKLEGELFVPDGGVVRISDGLTLASGKVTLNSAASYSVLDFAGSQAVAGSGEIVFNGTNSYSQTYASSGTLTIGSGVTVRTGTQGGTVGQMGMGLMNQGVISAQTAGTTLTVQGTNWTNESTGTLEARDAATLTLGGTWKNRGLIAVDHGTVNLGGTFSFEGGGAISGRRGTVNLTGTLENSGWTWTIDGDVGVFNLAGGGTVKGGTIKSVNDGELVSIAGLLDNVKLETDVAIGGGLVYLQVSNGLTLSNTKIRMVSDGGWYGTTSLSFLGSQTLGGSGEVVFEGKDGRNYMSAGSGVLTIGKGIVIRSGVQGGGVGQSATGLVNQGTISAQTAGTTVTVSGVDWVNDVGGLLEAKDGGTLALNGSWKNLPDGQVKTDGSGMLILRGTWTNEGVIDVDGRLLAQTNESTRDGVYAMMLDQVRSARDAGWPAKWITSSAARNDVRGMTGLAVVLNADPGAPFFYIFGGQSIDSNSILVQYTWNGDANLDGVVNADDYFRIDTGFITQKRGWYNGDFNHDGVVNADDYFLIDRAFLGQNRRLPASAARSGAAVPEPGMGLLGAAVAGLLLRRRRDRVR